MAPALCGLCIVATLPKEGSQKQDTLANAQLIAAAPELLAALEACVETLDAAKRQANAGCEWIASIEARAAIAKAGGAR